MRFGFMVTFHKTTNFFATFQLRPPWWLFRRLLVQ